MSTASTLLLRGGRVIDPASRHDGVADVLIDGDRIVGPGAGLTDGGVGGPGSDGGPAPWPGPVPRPGPGSGPGAGGPQPSPTRVIDCSGLIVTPGLIDLHVHVYPGLGDFCLHPDRVGVQQGVPTVIDAGTSGVATFGLARKWIDDPSVKTRVLALMDPCQIYFATKDFICHRLEIANDERNLDPESTAAALEANRDVVVGLKVRACSTTDPSVSPFLNAAVRVAGPRPVMVHLGRFPHTPTIPTSDLLRVLRGGDVITHAFRGASGVIGPDGKVTPEFRDAVDRGVRLDVGHSGTDFRFSTARVLFDQGYLPTTISTDLNVFNIDHPVISLAHTMSKLLALEVELADVVAMTTWAPATVVRRQDELGVLAPGRGADISVLRVEEAEVELSDGYETITAGPIVSAVGCVRGGEWIPASPEGRSAVSA